MTRAEMEAKARELLGLLMQQAREGKLDPQVTATLTRGLAARRAQIAGKETVRTGGGSGEEA